jgi:hypothetical protein
MLMFLLVSYSALAFKMEGITFNKSLKDGYKEFIIHNEGTKKIRYRVFVRPSGKEDITDCIEVFPKIITIEPKSSQVLKMFGKAKRELENKEYPFYLDFQQIVIPTLGKSDGKTISGSSTMSLAPSVEMKGHGGVIDYSQALNLENMKFYKDEKGNLMLDANLVNNSHGAIEIGLNFYNRDRSKLVSQGMGTVPANSNEKITINLDSFTDEKQIKYIIFYDEFFETIKEIERE